MCKSLHLPVADPRFYSKGCQPHKGAVNCQCTCISKKICMLKRKNWKTLGASAAPLGSVNAFGRQFLQDLLFVLANDSVLVATPSESAAPPGQHEVISCANSSVKTCASDKRLFTHDKYTRTCRAQYMSCSIYTCTAKSSFSTICAFTIHTCTIHAQYT